MVTCQLYGERMRMQVPRVAGPLQARSDGSDGAVRSSLNERQRPSEYATVVFTEAGVAEPRTGEREKSGAIGKTDVRAFPIQASNCITAVATVSTEGDDGGMFNIVVSNNASLPSSATPVVLTSRKMFEDGDRMDVTVSQTGPITSDTWLGE